MKHPTFQSFGVTVAFFALCQTALAQQSVTLQPRMGAKLNGLTTSQIDRFETGKVLYRLPIPIEEGLGPIINKSNCGSCHANPLGGWGAISVTRFGIENKGVFELYPGETQSLAQALSNSSFCAEIIPADATIVRTRLTNSSMAFGLVEAIPDDQLAANEVVVSIFVNPLQFENTDDLKNYPRSPERDIQLATLAGATEVWMPEYEEIYPAEIKKLSAGPLGALYEGQSRPDHFDGVVIVVNRLFEIVKPESAVFGEKDFQQLAIIKAMKSKVEIIGVPTVREFDGLALSSRNVRLSEQGRVSANVIQRALAAAHLAPSVVIAQEIIDSTLATETGFKKDYAAIIDEDSFEIASDQTRNKRAIIAGWIDGVRLIDNMKMGEGR